MRFFRLVRAAIPALLSLPALACAQGTSRQPSPTAIPAPLVRAEQLVVVVTPGWDVTTGSLRRFERTSPDAPWRSVGAPVPVVIGRTGLAWADASLASAMQQPVKHEGDGRSPAGAFPLDTAFGFAPHSELPWMKLPYAMLTPGSDCVDDERSAYYNTVVDRGAVARVDWTSAEHMRQVAQYRIGVIVGYNATPPQRGRGSCIFLHIWGGPASTTVGCTALDASELETLMRWLDRARHPAIVQLPSAEHERLRSAWSLPPA